MEPKDMKNIYELEASLKVVSVENIPVEAHKKIEEAFIPKSEKKSAELIGETWQAVEPVKEEKN